MKLLTPALLIVLLGPLHLFAEEFRGTVKEVNLERRAVLVVGPKLGPGEQMSVLVSKSTRLEEMDGKVRRGIKLEDFRPGDQVWFAFSGGRDDAEFIVRRVLRRSKK
jgi:hypothetical protein